VIDMDLWKLGFGLLIVGLAIPIGYGLYQFVLTPLEWYWRLSVLFIIAGVLILLVSAIIDRIGETKPEERY